MPTRPVSHSQKTAPGPPIAIAVATLVAVGRAGAAVAVGCALLVLLLAPRRTAAGEDRAPLVALAAAVFGVWLMPEFVVGDFSHRPVVEWKRWNLAMRFWLEGHYLVPFLAVLAFAPAVGRALADRRYSRALTAVGTVVGTLWLVTHAYALVERRTRTPDVPGLDATAFLARDHACDDAIVDFLRQLPGRVQVGELCGTAEFVKPVPLDYGWAGRIAAFSGRPGVCGWSRHVWQFTGTLRHGPAAGTPTRDWFREYEFHMMSAYFAAQRRSHAAGAREFLDRAGVTHVVLGEPERRLFPWLGGARLAAALGGRVEFEAGTGCAVIRLDQATGR
jgi:uncharacterized membrane protein